MESTEAELVGVLTLISSESGKKVILVRNTGATSLIHMETKETTEEIEWKLTDDKKTLSIGCFSTYKKILSFNAAKSDLISNQTLVAGGPCQFGSLRTPSEARVLASWYLVSPNSNSSAFPERQEIPIDLSNPIEYLFQAHLMNVRNCRLVFQKKGQFKELKEPDVLDLSCDLTGLPESTSFSGTHEIHGEKCRIKGKLSYSEDIWRVSWSSKDDSLSFDGTCGASGLSVMTRFAIGDGPKAQTEQFFEFKSEDSQNGVGSAETCTVS
jgi:hypothetical protein